MSLVIRPLSARRLRKVESPQFEVILSPDLAALDRGFFCLAG